MKKIICLIVVIYSLLIGLIYEWYTLLNSETEPQIVEITQPIRQHSHEAKSVSHIKKPTIPYIKWYDILSQKYEKPYKDVFNISQIVIKYCKEHKVSSNHIMSLIGVESWFNPNATSYKGAKYGRGLCQVSEIVLKEYNWHNEYGDIFEPNDLYDIEINIKVACWYFARLIDHYHKDKNFMETLSAYNRGPYDKVYAKSYVSKILDNLRLL